MVVTLLYICKQLPKVVKGGPSGKQHLSVEPQGFDQHDRAKQKLLDRAGSNLTLCPKRKAFPKLQPQFRSGRLNKLHSLQEPRSRGMRPPRTWIQSFANLAPDALRAGAQVQPSPSRVQPSIGSQGSRQQRAESSRIRLREKRSSDLLGLVVAAKLLVRASTTTSHLKTR